MNEFNEESFAEATKRLLETTEELEKCKQENEEIKERAAKEEEELRVLNDSLNDQLTTLREES